MVQILSQHNLQGWFIPNFFHEFTCFFMSVLPLLKHRFPLTFFPDYRSNTFFKLKRFIRFKSKALESCFLLQFTFLFLWREGSPFGQSFPGLWVWFFLSFSTTSNFILSHFLPSCGLGCWSCGSTLLHQVLKYFDSWTTRAIFPNQRIWTAIES